MAISVFRGEADYEQRRISTAWNRLVRDRYPDAIFAPSTRDELAGFVAQAHADGTRLAIKSGGHNWLSGFLQDGGALIDLGGLASVEVDIEHKRARVEPGATNKALSDAIVPHGLGFPTGHCPSVGLGGYLLAGGFGWNPRVWGPACWSVEAVDLITAAGDSITASDTSHSELFWAARGAGSGFPAIATRFHLRLHDLPKVVKRDVVVPARFVPVVMDWTAARIRALSPGTEIALVIRRPVDGGDSEPQVMIAVTAFGSDGSEVERLVEEALAGMPVTDITADSSVQEMALNDLEGSGWQAGLRYAADTGWITDDLAGASHVIERAIEHAPSALTRIVVTFADTSAQSLDTALSLLGPHSVSVYACWADAANDAVNLDWVRGTMSDLSPWVVGHYVGESDLYADVGRVRKCFTDEKWTRLERISATYDPRRRIQRFLGAR